MIIITSTAANKFAPLVISKSTAGVVAAVIDRDSMQSSHKVKMKSIQLTEAKFSVALLINIENIFEMFFKFWTYSFLSQTVNHV